MTEYDSEAHALTNESDLIETAFRKATDLAAELSTARLANEALSAKHQTCIDLIPDGLLIVDKNGTIESANTAASHLLGAQIQSMRGRSVKVFLGSCFELTDYVSAEGFSPFTTDGSYRVRLKVRVQQVVGDMSTSFFVGIRDVSEIRANQRRVKELAFLAEKISAVVLTFHPDHGIDWCNAQMQTVTGYPREHFIGSRFVDLIDVRGTPEVGVREILLALNRLQPFNAEVQLRHSSKPSFWARIEGHPLLDEAGNLDKYIVTGSDVSDERHQKSLQNDFCSMVSHELRTPLTVVSGTLEALEFGSCGEFSQQALELIQMGQRNCSHLSALIEDVLEINQLESGDIPLTLKPIIVFDTVQDVINTMATLFERSGHLLRLIAPDEHAVIMTDDTRLRQILTNLLSNARKFSRSGSEVTLSIDYGETVNIEVSDQGYGIPIEFQPKLFERFSRDVGVRASGIEGFGLGLSITKKLVDQMNGSISFESAQGIGTTFRVSFPRHSASPDSKSVRRKLQLAAPPTPKI